MHMRSIEVRYSLKFVWNLTNIELTMSSLTRMEI